MRGAFAILLALLAVCGGCGYMIGGGYHTDVRTVEVPMFTSQDFRRGLEFQLTEAVQRHVKSRTPYRLAEAPYADTRLSGNIVTVSKRGLTTTRGDEPREIQIKYAVEVVWEDLRPHGGVLREEVVDIPADLAHLIGEAEYAPEVGGSLATANKEAIDRLARRIVEMMEAPW